MFLLHMGFIWYRLSFLQSKIRGNGQYEIFFPVVRFIAYGLICAKIILDFLEKGYSKKNWH